MYHQQRFLSSRLFVLVLPLSILGIAFISYKGRSLGVYPFDEMSAAECGFKLSCSSKVLVPWKLRDKPLFRHY